jgi:hypothetical protein
MVNNNALMFMKVEDEIEINWVHISYSKICAMNWIDGLRCRKKCRHEESKRTRRKFVI